MSTSRERWRYIAGAEGQAVSSHGRVMSERGNLQKLNASSHDGYLRASVKIDDKWRMYYVHTLVLTAFVGQRPAGHECRHLNGDPRDNRLTNLAWGTRKENARDTVAHGRSSRGERSHNAKLTWQDAAAIRQAKGPPGLNNRLAEHYGVSNVTISLIRSGKHWAEPLPA